MRSFFALPLVFMAGAANAQVDLSPPKAVWDSDLDGSAIHRISTLQCPAANGTFHRFNVQLYDKAGFDVGCDYRAEGSEITVYLTRIDPAEFDHHFEIARKAAAERFSNTASRDGTLPLPPGFEWRRASFLLPSGMISDVLMAPFHGWYFEVRVSYRPDKMDETEKSLAELSALALQTAGQHLAACEARPPMPPDGQRITDKAKIQSLALVSGTLLGKVEIKGASPPPPAPAGEILSCADSGFSIGNDHFVFWRDVPSRGTTIERITGIERSFAATTRASLTDILAELSSTKGQLANQTFGPLGVMVLVDRGEDWDVMGFFEGLPSMNDMGEAALLGRPVARVNKAGNHITLFTDLPAK